MADQGRPTCQSLLCKPAQLQGGLQLAPYISFQAKVSTAVVWKHPHQINTTQVC